MELEVIIKAIRNPKGEIFKIGDVVTVSRIYELKDITYTGKITEIGNDYLVLDCSEKYSAVIHQISFNKMYSIKHLEI